MPQKRHLNVGTRTSQLARWQTQFVISLLSEAWPNLHCEVCTFDTRGDRTLDKPLPEIGGKGLFTAELEQALLAGDIDIAVHSLKDLPVQNPPGLTLGAIPAREDVGDVLVAPGFDDLAALPPGAVVGTSSLRRQAQLLAARPDLRVRPVRGNVETRVRKAQQGDYDAVVLAAAGLRRLGIGYPAGAAIPFSIMLPAPGQGALGVQCRANDPETLHLLQAIDSAEARRATTAERRFLQALGGGCSAPIAAYARPAANGILEFDGLIASPSGGALIRVSGNGEDPVSLAERLASQARQQGADGILATIEPAADRHRAPSTEGALHGRRIVVTRAREQAPEFAGRLRDLGATPILFPTIRITPMDDNGPLDEAIRNLQRYDWVVFTSVNGVDVFQERLSILGLGPEQFDGVRLSAIGPATGDALAAIGLSPDFIPDEFVAERIAAGLGDVKGQRILLPRAQQARATLANLLQDAGAHVDEIPTYRTVEGAPDDEAIRRLADADVITFTSSSTVRNFVSLVGGSQKAAQLIANALVACIGPITAGTARELGLEPHIVARDYTIDGLLEALVSHYQ